MYIGEEGLRSSVEHETGYNKSDKNSILKGSRISKNLLEDEEDNNLKITNCNYTNTNSDLLTNTLIQNRNNLNSIIELNNSNNLKRSLQSETKNKNVSFSSGTSNFFRKLRSIIKRKNDDQLGSTPINIYSKKTISKFGGSFNNNLNSLSPLENSKSQYIKIRERRRQSVFLPHRMDNFTPTNRLTVLSPRNVNSSEDDESESQVDTISQNTFTYKKKDTIEQIKLESIKKGKFNINVQAVLVDHLKYGEYVCDCLCLLLSIDEKCFNLVYTEKIFTNLLVYTMHEEDITKCSEPLLFVALASEFLIKIGTFSKRLQFKAQTVANEILELGEKLQGAMRDGEMLYYYLNEQTDHEGRNALEIYAENKFYTLFRDISVGSLIEKMWYGSGKINAFFKYLRMTRIMITPVNFDEYKNIVKTNFYDESFHFAFEYETYLEN